MKKNNRHGDSRNPCHQRRGPSSIWIHDPDVVFNALRLKEGDVVLDLGCGPGDYALKAATIVQNTGEVYALDKDQYLLDGLIAEADAQRILNIRAKIADITDTLPIGNDRIDVCLLFTVLHSLRLSTIERSLFNEIGRVLKPKGRVTIIELKKEEQPFGPPIDRRLSPDEIEKSISKFGFDRLGITDLGYTYMIQFSAHQHSSLAVRRRKCGKPVSSSASIEYWRKS
jgi:SAM-dependent methyltransferase